MHFILKESLDKGLSKFLRHLMQAWKSNLEVHVKGIRVILCNAQKIISLTVKIQVYCTEISLRLIFCFTNH